MITIEGIAELRARCERARHEDQRVGIVPTMGYFHDGHRSLMRAARADNDLVVVTLFVNPTQFAAGEDLDAYPRDLVRDTELTAAERVDVLFVPTVAEMYPLGPRTTVHVEGLTEGLCGARRPGHFDGMTTIVAKLFSIVGPCRAYFGRKDAQQLAVVQAMTADLDLAVEVVGCPLVREPDGLAMSSRNAYLRPGEREAATVLWRALRAAADAMAAGERDAEPIRRIVVDVIATEPLVTLEYAELVDARTLSPVQHMSGDTLLAVAAQVGRARLIDNLYATVTARGVAVDLGV